MPKVQQAGPGHKILTTHTDLHTNKHSHTTPTNSHPNYTNHNHAHDDTPTHQQTNIPHNHTPHIDTNTTTHTTLTHTTPRITAFVDTHQTQKTTDTLGPTPEIIAIIANLQAVSTLDEELQADRDKYMIRRAHQRTNTGETEASTSTHQPHITHQTVPHKTHPSNTPDTDTDTGSTTSTADTVIHIETTHTTTQETQTTDDDTDNNTDTTSLTDTDEQTQTPQPTAHTTRDTEARETAHNPKTPTQNHGEATTSHKEQGTTQKLIKTHTNESQRTKNKNLSTMDPLLTPSTVSQLDLLKILSQQQEAAREQQEATRQQQEAAARQQQQLIQLLQEQQEQRRREGEARERSETNLQDLLRTTVAALQSVHLMSGTGGPAVTPQGSRVATPVPSPVPSPVPVPVVQEIRHPGRIQDVRDSSLASCLRTPALNVLTALSEEEISDYQKLSSALELRYGNDHLTKLYTAQLQTRRQGRDEDLASLSQDIERLSRVALPDHEPSQSENLLIHVRKWYTWIVLLHLKKINLEQCLQDQEHPSRLDL
ncbi:homeobox protein 5-like [Neodiprion fabricii]|uniref:homeobox protein 5-like n=1 Tax=Neodiprion fabricii TaxID=2872261 RepID=UPI001ED96A00|nr:homeobox protein 5-like [Neodiprion fabricii]